MAREPDDDERWDGMYVRLLYVRMLSDGLLVWLIVAATLVLTFGAALPRFAVDAITVG